MKVSIDVDMCIGAGTCEDVCSEYFRMKDGLAVLVEPGETRTDDDIESHIGWLTVREDLEAKVQEAADECPAECIYIRED